MQKNRISNKTIFIKVKLTCLKKQNHEKNNYVPRNGVNNTVYKIQNSLKFQNILMKINT